MSSQIVARIVDTAIPFFGGLYFTLLAYRVVGVRSGDPKWEAWHRNWGRHGKWLGPTLMGLSVILFFIRTR